MDVAPVGRRNTTIGRGTSPLPVAMWEEDSARSRAFRAGRATLGRWSSPAGLCNDAREAALPDRALDGDDDRQEFRSDRSV